MLSPLFSSDGGYDPRRFRILDHASRIFLTQGYEGTNIETIANAAGVSKVTIYNYFGDKQGLIAAVVRAAAINLSTACSQTLDVNGDMDAVLTKFAARYIAGITQN